MSVKRRNSKRQDSPLNLHDRYKEVQARKVKARSRFIHTILVLSGVVAGVIFLGYTLTVQQHSNSVVITPIEGDISATDCSIEKCVALTFDDGPTELTDKLLDTLEKNDGKATFFYVGKQAELYPETVKRASDDGHGIGNHTWNHNSLNDNNAEYNSGQVYRTQEILESITGTSPLLFRPPYGDYSEEHFSQIQLPFILWSMHPAEGSEIDSDEIYQSVMNEVEPGSIILSHDTNLSTVEAYKRIIPDLIEAGYTLVTVEDLLNINADNMEYKAYFKYPE